MATTSCLSALGRISLRAEVLTALIVTLKQIKSYISWVELTSSIEQRLSFQQLTTKQLFRACWYRLTFLCISEDLPENMGPKISSICPNSCIVIRLYPPTLFKIVKLLILSTQICYLLMDFDSQQTFSLAQPDSHSESFKLKLTFTERNLQRIREENSRLSQKILRLEEENAKLTSQQKVFLDKIDKLEMTVTREKVQKEGLIKRLQVRTQRHEAQQCQNLTKAQKQVLQKRIKKAEAELIVINDQRSLINKKYQSLATQLQQQRQENMGLRQQIVSLQKHNLEDIDKIQQVEQLYREKITLIETQNHQLKQQIDSLIIEVKLFQRKKEIEGLLNYQDRIGLDSTTKRTRTCIDRSYLNDKQNRMQQCSCAELEQQLFQKEQLIGLLKEKNSRLQGELESLKKRCVTLQNIVCRSDSFLK